MEVISLSLIFLPTWRDRFASPYKSIFLNSMGKTISPTIPVTKGCTKNFVNHLSYLSSPPPMHPFFTPFVTSLLQKSVTFGRGDNN